MTSTSITLYDESDPHHFLNLINESLKLRYLALPAFLHQLTEKQLILQVYNSPEPPDIDIMLRMEFWDLYEERFQSRKKITNIDIFRSVCSLQSFDEVSKTLRLAYVFRELPHYRAKLKLLHKIAGDQLLKTLQRIEEVNQRTGLTDPALTKLKVDIYKHLDTRLHGAIVQRHEISQTVDQRTVQVNVDGGKRVSASPPAPSKDYSQMSYEELEERNKFLEGELGNVTRSQTSILPPREEDVIMGQIVEESGRVSEEYKRHDQRK